MLASKPQVALCIMHCGQEVGCVSEPNSSDWLHHTQKQITIVFLVAIRWGSSLKAPVVTERKCNRRLLSRNAKATSNDFLELRLLLSEVSVKCFPLVILLI